MSQQYDYVCEKLRRAVLTMMAHRGVPRDRLVITILTELSDDDVRWLIDRLHSLAFSMEVCRATHALRSLGRRESEPGPVAGSRS